MQRIFFFLLFKKHIYMYFLLLAFRTIQSVLLKGTVENHRFTELWSNSLSEYLASQASCPGPWLQTASLPWSGFMSCGWKTIDSIFWDCLIWTWPCKAQPHFPD